MNRSHKATKANTTIGTKLVSGIVGASLVFALCPLVVGSAVADPSEESTDSTTTAEQQPTTGEASEGEGSTSEASESNTEATSSENSRTNNTKGSVAKKKAKKKKKAAAKKFAKADKIANRLALLTVSLETTTEEMGAVSVRSVKLKRKIAKTKKKLKQTKEALAAARDNVAQSACAMYKDGSVRYLSVMLGATTFEDFASRLFLYEEITTEWQRIIDEAKQLSEEVEQQKAKLNKQKAELKALKAEVEQKGDAVAATLETQLSLLEGLDDDLVSSINKKAEKYLTRYESTISKASTASLAWAAGTDKASTSKKGSHPAVVDIAKQFLGVPYVWGGETPSGFDCSGLTMYCYKQIGITLTHYARTQYDEGKHIAKSALMPGDLVFFGSSVETIHHVGIYIGGGKYLHAPHTGDVVKISKLSDRSDCVGACRPGAK